MCLAYAALQCLLNKPGETTFGFSVSVAVSRTLWVQDQIVISLGLPGFCV